MSNKSNIQEVVQKAVDKNEENKAADALKALSNAQIEEQIKALMAQKAENVEQSLKTLKVDVDKLVTDAGLTMQDLFTTYKDDFKKFNSSSNSKKTPSTPEINPEDKDWVVITLKKKSFLVAKGQGRIVDEITNLALTASGKDKITKADMIKDYCSEKNEKGEPIIFTGETYITKKAELDKLAKTQEEAK